MTLWHWFQQGGPVMWLLLGCSMASFALIVERTVFWFAERRRVPLDALESFVRAMGNRDVETARTLADRTESPLMGELVEAWEKDGAPGIMETMDRAINRLEKRSTRYLYGLKTIVSVSPLMGILGTVLGIIQAFEVMGGSGAAADPAAVGAGLAEALITTAFGLMIAVPALVAHNYFRSKARRYVDELDERADHLAYHLPERPREPAAADDAEPTLPLHAARDVGA